MIAQDLEPDQDIEVVQSGEGTKPSPAPHWSLLSPHGLVLFFLAMNEDSTLREIAQRVGVTERTVYTVIRDLSRADMVRTARAGRRNSYTVNGEAHFVHPIFAHLRIGNFLDTLKPPTSQDAAPESPATTSVGVRVSLTTRAAGRS